MELLDSPCFRELTDADNSLLCACPPTQNSVGDSVLYRAGQAYMARRDYTPKALLDQLDMRRADVFPEPNYYLFDLRVRHREPTIIIHVC